MTLQKHVAVGGLLALCGACGGARAQALHAADYLIRVADQRIETGVVGAGGQAVFPARVLSGVFGDEGIPNFTNDPGVNAQNGQLVPGMTVGFDILGPLLDWDAESGFVSPSADRLTVRKSGINTQTPLTDTVVPGIVFGQAGLDAAAGFHHHVQFIFNPALGGAPDGLWLFTWALWTEAPGIERTEPLYVVFAQGAGASEIDDAVAWVEANLVGTACLPDFAEPFDMLNVFDLFAYLEAYSAEEPRADLAAPFGAWNVFDLFAYLEAYGAGCP